ncbi:DUF397 domain-containing protein [Streptomyces sp. NPDC003077]|uniref:DUF397 domain-containing protein n=1 Tax=Streptomyces sp. NPDC003077 TaxID=3154443 RepID=UPI0033B55F7A
MTTHAPNAAELPVRWTTSSYSGGGNNCVQVAALRAGRLAVRDSKRATGPALLFPDAAWEAFLATVRAGAGRD